jgi:pimeloyl-ACP methyl ester carboxylesterase
LTVRLNTNSWGHGGGSPIVCVHGVTGHAEQFRKLAQDTLADRRVLAMDLRGHGRSGWLPPWNLETHVATSPRQPRCTPSIAPPGSGSAWAAAWWPSWR